jgi:hypothetical protein
MQNKFFGDIHDFYKYYFLKEVTKDYSFGIHWCLVPDETSKKDGRKPLTAKEERKDTDLYNLLTKNNHNIKTIEQYFSERLGHGQKYFYRLHEHYYNDYLYEEEAVNELESQDIIFFDPDNGIEVPSTDNQNKFKYISYRLLYKFWSLGKSLIIYQHADRKKGSIEEKIRILYNLIDKKANVITVKRGQVTYICIIQGDEHYIMKDELVEFRKNKEYKVENWEGTGDIC